mmetsp:Transcript_113460/g.315578  ORF Transcript_113460/g.315578 Transcript_113460/m.315578 type:complete len:238 (+) Transcript_113460:279-992(+)
MACRTSQLPASQTRLQTFASSPQPPPPHAATTPAETAAREAPAASRSVQRRAPESVSQMPASERAKATRRWPRRAWKSTGPLTGRLLTSPALQRRIWPSEAIEIVAPPLEIEAPCTQPCAVILRSSAPVLALHRASDVRSAVTSFSPQGDTSRKVIRSCFCPSSCNALPSKPHTIAGSPRMRDAPVTTTPAGRTLTTRCSLPRSRIPSRWRALPVPTLHTTALSDPSVTTRSPSGKT